MNIQVSPSDWEVIHDALIFFRKDLHSRLDHGETGFFKECLTQDVISCDRIVDAIEVEKFKVIRE